jgi:hypothetical protein
MSLSYQRRENIHTVHDHVKDEYDLVKLKISYSLKMKLTDTDFLHLLLEHDIDNEIEKQLRKKWKVEKANR